MINQVLTYYTHRLEGFLSAIYHQPEGMVKLAHVDAEETANKLVVCLLGVERETAQGISPGNVRDHSGDYRLHFPPLNMNLNVVFAAVYDAKRYADALSVLSSTLLFLQANPVFVLPGNQKYTIEVVTLSSQELSNVWTYLGGHYYPSVVCKVRKLTFDAGQVRGTAGQAGVHEVGTKKKGG